MKRFFSLIIPFVLLICMTSSVPGTSPEPDYSCTISEYEEVDAAARRCDVLTLEDLVIPKMKSLEISLKPGAKLIFDGHITHDPVAWNGHLIKITGDNVEIYGTQYTILDGMGPDYWKGNMTVQSPKVLKLEVSNAKVHHLFVKNCPNTCIEVQSSNTNISDVFIENNDGNPDVADDNYAKNTDGFDISSSTNVKIRSTRVYNQGDCIVVNSGTHLHFVDIICERYHGSNLSDVAGAKKKASSSTNVKIRNASIYHQDDCIVVKSGTHLHFDDIFCEGSGLSFSVSGGDIHNVLFSKCLISDASSVIHIKTHSNSQNGSISNVTFSDISFIRIEKYAINIQQNYPSGEATANVKISNLVLDKVQGFVSGGMATSIICAEKGCSDWHWNDVKIYATTQKNECHYVPAGIPC